MRSSVLAALLAIASTGSAGVCHRAVCNADNCARLVYGTRAGLPSTRLADCSSFLGLGGPSTVTSTATVTVTPVVTYVSTITTNPVFQDTTVVVTPEVTEVSTTTSTVYEDTTVTVSTLSIVRQGAIVGTFLERAVAPSSSSSSAAAAAATVTATGTVPAYAASACTNPARYSSACSCAGVKASTSTTTVTTTATVTAPAATVEADTAATTTVARVFTAVAEPVTALAYATETATVTRTSTATAAGATQTGYACGSTVQGNGIYSFRRYRVNCGQRVTAGQVSFSSKYPNESACLRICNSIKYCVYAEYAFDTGSCDLYYQPPTAIVDDDGRDALILI